MPHFRVTFTEHVIVGTARQAANKVFDDIRLGHSRVCMVEDDRGEKSSYLVTDWVAKLNKKIAGDSQWQKENGVAPVCPECGAPPGVCWSQSGSMGQTHTCFRDLAHDGQPEDLPNPLAIMAALKEE